MKKIREREGPTWKPLALPAMATSTAYDPSVRIPVQYTPLTHIHEQTLCLVLSTMSEKGPCHSTLWHGDLIDDILTKFALLTMAASATYDPSARVPVRYTPSTHNVNNRCPWFCQQ